MSQLLLAVFATATFAFCDDNPLSSFDRVAHAHVNKIVLASAEKVPEEKYSYRPTDSVRTFAQLFGHIADSQYYFCSVALQEKNPAPGIEKTKTTKSDLIAALKEVFAYCDRAYNKLNDKDSTQTVKMMNSESPILSVASVNDMHTMEHYGNLVTYMRMNNIVPPTSEPATSSDPKPQTKTQP